MRLSILTILASLLIGSAAPAAEKVVLFDGKDLSAWLDKEGKPAGWKIVDGAMEVNGSGDIHTKESFGDYTLHVEFRTPTPKEGQKGQNRGNSGVFVGDLYEIQVLDSFGLQPTKGDCGSVYNQKPPDENMAKPPMEWQTYDIEYRAPRWDAGGKKTENARVTVVWNGKKVHDTVEIVKGTSGKTAPEKPGPAPIRLQDHQHPVQYRNIHLVPVPSVTDGAGTLFNGKNLDGWKQAGPGSFEVRDGAMHTVGGMGLLWYDQKQFADYSLSFEFKNSKADDNSGVFVRFPDPQGDPWKPVKEGEEIQINDASKKVSTGGIYNVQVPSEKASNSPGEWNAMQITVVGQRITVTVNGKQVTDYTSAKPAPSGGGYLGFQNHDPNSHVSFRDVKVREITKPAK